MKKCKIKFLIALISFITLLFSFLKINNTTCDTYKDHVNDRETLSEIINEHSESKSISWGEMLNVYGIFDDVTMENIYHNPEEHFKEAINIISNPAYDESQKIYTIILMQKLPIQNYICLMDVVNESYNRGIINKTVARFAILPDVNVFGTPPYYWWLPGWRKRFNQHASDLVSPETVDSVLSGEYFFYHLLE